MRKIFYLMFFMMVFLLIKEASAFCCGDPSTGQCKCFGAGYCCDKDTGAECAVPPGDCSICIRSPSPCSPAVPSGYDFKFWVEPTYMMFTVGKKTLINLYIENTGNQGDSYRVNFSVTSVNPSLIVVEMPIPHPTGQSGITEVINVDPNEKVVKNPRVLILSTDATGHINFTGTSQGEPTLPSQTVTLHIVPSELPLSLPEFNLFGIIGILVVGGIVYFLRTKKN